MGRITINKKNPQKEITGGHSREDLKNEIKKLKKEFERIRPVDVPLEAIRTGEPFRSLFPIKAEVLSAISRDMAQNGFDINQPIIIWDEMGILIDGHTRREAARKSGLSTIPARYVSFPDQTAAIQYAYSLQTKRRNLTDADRFVFLENYLCNVAQKMDGWKKTFVAELLAVSERTAQKYINILNKGSESLKNEIRLNELSINKADRQLKNDLDNSKPSKAALTDSPPAIDAKNQDFIQQEVRRIAQRAIQSLKKINALDKIDILVDEITSAEKNRQ